MHIPARLDDKVMLVMGRVDCWPDRIAKASDKTLMMFAIHNIAKEYLDSCTLQAVNLEHYRFLWLIQPTASLVEFRSDSAEPLWDRAVRLVHGGLEMIQSTSLELLNVPISIASGHAEVEWRHLPSCYEHLRAGLGRGLGIGQETIVMERRPAADEAQGESENAKLAIRNLLRKWTGTDYYYDTGVSQKPSSFSRSWRRNWNPSMRRPASSWKCITRSPLTCWRNGTAGASSMSRLRTFSWIKCLTISFMRPEGTLSTI
ncbi:hypothetical protein LJK88_25895 [Paenibacillus sp. P26]|nr:hypothetical protein LJK88_25895 [Paenibacillus sp. P26]